MTPIPNHVERGVGRLLQKLKQAPRIVAFVSALLMEVQELSDALYDLWLAHQIGSAHGARLDAWGAVVGAARDGRGDDAYRVRIQAQLLLMRGSGTVPELIHIFQVLAPAPRRVDYVSRWPAGQELHIRGAISNEGADLANILQEAKAAGVKSTLHWLAADPADSFVTLGASSGKGLTLTGSPAGTGGILSRAVG